MRSLDEALDDLRVAAVGAAARRQGSRPSARRVRKLLHEGLSMDAALLRIVHERKVTIVGAGFSRPFTSLLSRLLASRWLRRWIPLVVAMVLSLATGAAAQQGAAQTYHVARVIDGDTILLDVIGRVRLIGVDTPETVDPRRPVQRFGKEASDFTRRMVGGKDVRVEYDWNRKDRYNRTLAYIYLPDGTFVNAEIVRRGYGFAYTKYPFKYAADFRKLEREARDKRLGLWAPTTPAPSKK